MFSLKGRVAVVTGASSGLGLQMAQGFAEQDVDLVIMARRMDKLKAIAAEFEAKGTRCLPIQCDVTSTEEINRAAAQVIAEYGQVGNTAMDTVAYHASKGGVINFTRAVAAELAQYNITCNTISPGYFETELTADTLKTDSFTNFMKTTVPLGRYGYAGELNPVAVMLASDEARYITGQNIKVDGGYTSV
ncbi:MAG: SDR family oxidoreductase [Clostridia bacterium]|nr:SDR family oxidoreductase [Clostridia bacterium]